MQLMVGHSLLVTSLGEVWLLTGRLEEAAESARLALTLSREHEERGYEARALRLLGELALQREPPDLDGAAEFCRQACALAGELGMRPLVAQSHLLLGRVHARAGRSLAEAQLAMAAALFRELGMPFWARQAETALATGSG